MELDKKNAEVNERKLKYRCKFRGCTSAYYVGTIAKVANKHFFRFPKDKNLLSQWKSVCKVPEDYNFERIFVCEDHFLQRDFVNKHRQRLNPGVCPKHLELVPYVPRSNIIGLDDTRANNTTKSIDTGSDENFSSFENSCEAFGESAADEILFNFEGFCRLCMKQEKDMLPIFTEELNLLVKLSHILPKLKIRAGDGLPSDICQECIQQIEVIHYFLTQCEVSDSTFRKYLRKQIKFGNRGLMPEEQKDPSTLRISSVFSLGTPVSRAEITVQDSSTQTVEQEYEEKVRDTPVNFRNTLAVPNNSLTQRSGSLNISRLTTPVIVSVPARKSSAVQKSRKLQEASVSNTAAEQIVVVQNTSSQSDSAITSSEKKELMLNSINNEAPVKLQKPNGDNVSPQVMKLQMNKNSSASSNIYEESSGVKLGNVTTIPPLVLLQENRKSGFMQLEKCSNIDDQHEEVTNEVENCDVAAVQQETNSTSKTKKLNTYKYTKRMYLIPLQLLQQNTTVYLPNIPTASRSTSSEADKPNVRSRNTKTLYKCARCGREFVNRATCWKHYKAHDKFRCADCGLELFSAHQLKIHRRKHFEGKQIAALCEKCGQGFSQKYAYVKHYNMHLGLKPYECPQCKKCFTSSASRKIHLRRHNGEMPFICEKCGRRFTYMGGLVNHRRVHDEHIRPYKCTLCLKTYRSSTGLRNHRMIHTGRKPFECPDCGHGFAYRALLWKHRLVHTRERNYVCQYCGRSFLSGSAKVRHIRTHIGGTVYKCGDCNRVYSILKYFRNHSIRVHGKQVQCL